MPPLDKEIERPLAGPHDKAERRRFDRPDRTTLIAVLAGAAIVAGSAAIAVRDDGFRRLDPKPDTVTVVPPEREGSDASSETSPVASRIEDTDGGPSIIHVDPPPERESDGDVVVIRDPSSIGQNLRVAHLPDRDLIEESEYGPLPKRADDGRRPFDVYARPWSGARGARIAIVIGGLGLSQTGTQNAIERLPGEVTLAFAPHGNSIGRWMTAARRGGHEIILQIPLEPFDYPRIDPGRYTLTVGAGDETNIANLLWALGRTTNYTGVMNYMGARFVSDRDALEPVLSELGRRGLLYLDDGTSARSVAPQLASTKDVPLAIGDAVIDGSKDRGAIIGKLDELERIARARGYAIGTGSAFEATVVAVADWIGEARKRGIEIVPVSALAVDPERR